MEVTFDLIKQANETIITTDIKGKDYAQVNQRIKAFRMIYPKGAILTEEIYLNGELGSRVVGIKATVTDETGFVLGTGHADEKENSTYINKTSFIENCETSAIGRALGMAGFGIDVSVASAEEVQNAINNQEKSKSVSKDTFSKLKMAYSNVDIRNMYQELGITKGSDMTEEYAQKKLDEYYEKLKKDNQSETKEFF